MKIKIDEEKGSAMRYQSVTYRQQRFAHHADCCVYWTLKVRKCSEGRKWRLKYSIYGVMCILS